jgi:hypothetical protein
MPWLVTAIIGGLASGLVQFVFKALAAIGVGYLTFKGADMLVTQNEAQVLALLGTMPPLALQIVGVLKVGVLIKIVFSAMVMRLTVMGLNEGVIKRMKVVG